MDVTGNRTMITLEIAAMQDLCSLATEAERAALGLYCRMHGNTLVMACRAEHGILMNRTIGLGAADMNRLDEIIAVYREHQVARAFLSMPQAQAAILEPLLRRRGLSEARAWTKFIRDDAPAMPSRTDLVVRQVSGDHAMAFGRIIATAFDLPEGFAPVLGRLTTRANWHAFMTFAGEQPAGAGALYVSDGMAWLGFGATDPAFRRRGSQSAIMAARIDRARELGAKTMTTETGEAVPGDLQHSWKNIERAGFAAHHRICNYALTP